MKPILFNTEMVKAILDGRKTVTRRCAKFVKREEFPNVDLYSSACEVDKLGSTAYCIFQKIWGCWNEMTLPLKPKYVVGDILYVREIFGFQTRHGGRFFVYRADECGAMNYDVGAKGSYPTTKVKWKPSIHMPKEAARLFLRVTDVRIERLQDIRYHEVYREGIPSAPNCEQCGNSGNCANSAINGDCYQLHSFAYLWNSTLDKKGIETYGWDANPYVFVYEFEVISKEEAK